MRGGRNAFLDGSSPVPEHPTAQHSSSCPPSSSSQPPGRRSEGVFFPGLDCPGLRFRPQFEYPRGMFMCTTACLQVGMATLCGQIDPRAIFAASRCRDQAVCTEAVARIDELMASANVVHGRVETILFREQSRRMGDECDGVDGCGRSCAPHRMVSVNELIGTLKIDMPKLGLIRCEYMVCEAGVGTLLVPRIEESARTSAQKKEDGLVAPTNGRHAAVSEPLTAPAVASPVRRLVLAADSYHVGLSHIPSCMVVRSRPGEGQRTAELTVLSYPLASVALATANGHTVCGMWHADADGRNAQYAFFDPAPGTLLVGMDADDMVDAIASSIRIPSRVRGPLAKDVPRRLDEDDNDRQEEEEEAKGSRTLARDMQASALPNLLPGVSLSTQTGTQAAAAAAPVAPQREFEHGEFYCDVTIFYLQ